MPSASIQAEVAAWDSDIGIFPFKAELSSNSLNSRPVLEAKPLTSEPPRTVFLLKSSTFAAAM